MFLKFANAFCYIIANIKCIFIISFYSFSVFLNHFYKIVINKENELVKMRLQLCQMACSRHGCISFSPRSIDLSLDGIGALERFFDHFSDFFI